MNVDLAQGVIVRWKDADPAHVPLLREAGVQAALLDAPNPAFSAACQAADIQTAPAQDFQWLPLKELGGARAGRPVALKEGSVPGVSRGPNVRGRGDDVASPSRDPWIDINSYWIAWLRALFPGRPAVLGYTPDLGDRIVPFDWLELALIEAQAAGGNVILHPDAHTLAALQRGDEQALAAWRQLGRTAAWLREHRELLGRPVFPQITQLVELNEETPEIARLLYRRIASPALEAVARCPAPDPGRRLALVAVGLTPPAGAIRDRILAHAEAGACVVADGTWWRNSRLQRARKEEDRDIYTLGKGRVVAYRDTIADPSEFAMDVIDLITHKRRAARLWNAPAVVAVASGKGILQCINYGTARRMPAQARIQGNFSKATMLQPDAAPQELKPARRGTTTEVLLPEFRRLALVVFE